MLARFRLPLIVLAVAGLPALPVAASAQPARSTAKPVPMPPRAATRTPQVPTTDGSPRTRGVLARRPKLIVYSGDGAAYVGGSHRRRRGAGPISWSSWGGAAAVGTGANWLDNCTPNCAKGRFTAYPAQIRLDRPKRLGGRLVFSRLTLTYTARRPAHEHGRFVLRLRYSRAESTYVW